MKLNNTYYILRHGLSTSNVQYWSAGWPETKRKSHLVPQGKKQIKKAAQEFKKIGIDIIYSSDMHRTKQTSAIVSKTTGAKIILNKKLREIDYGIFANKSVGEYTSYFKGIRERLIKKTPRGQTLLECQKRMIKAIKEIDKKHKNKKILIVSHGNPLWLLEAAVKDWNREKLIEEYPKRILPGEWRKIN